MMRLMANLLVLVAVALLPLGMESTAAAAAGSHHADLAAMPMGHCADEQQGDVKGGIAECTMMCASALPAAAASAPARLLILCEPPSTAGVQRLNGIEPAIATPPPKRS